jgi:Flp pilus assembly protein TadD
LQATALRGIGVSLIELGELDRAETALRESLEVEPGNALAQNELLYISNLRSRPR